MNLKMAKELEEIDQRIILKKRFVLHHFQKTNQENSSKVANK